MTLYRATAEGNVPMTAEEEAAIRAEWEANANRPPEVPQEVTMRQARLALLGAGLLDAVETAINALQEPQKTAAKIEWEYSQTVQRNKGLVVNLSAALGLTSAQVDDLFRTAKTL